MGKKDPVFAANFKRLHARSGLTHEQIADEVGVKSGTVASWSKGVRVANGPNLAALCRVLKCTPDDLMRPHHNGKLRPAKPLARQKR